MAQVKNFKERLDKVMKRIEANDEDAINMMLEAEIIGCNEDELSVEYRYPVKDWELNSVGHLHGGITAAIFDLSMGILANAISDSGWVPTIEMNVTYLRPVFDRNPIIVKARVEKFGNSITHLSSDIYSDGGEKRIAMATAMFFNS